jgi:serine kinase of HPr protein (carbohydrate metabolism regulator)
MKVVDIVDVISGKVVCGHSLLDTEISHVFSSNLLSDVLTLNKTGVLLITHLANLQTIRTAEMAEVSCVILERNQKANQEMIALACETGLMIVESPMSMHSASDKLHQYGIQLLHGTNAHGENHSFCLR